MNHDWAGGLNPKSLCVLLVLILQINGAAVELSSFIKWVMVTMRVRVRI